MFLKKLHNLCHGFFSGSIKARFLIYIERAPKSQSEAEKAPKRKEVKPEMPPPGVPIDNIYEKEAQKPPEGFKDVNWVDRSPDALTPQEFAQKLDQCKTLEERQALIIGEAAKGAFDDSFKTPKFYKTQINGKEVVIPLYTNLAMNGITLGPDGQTMQTIADMLGALPTSFLYQRMLNDPRVQKVPFIIGERLEKEVNADRQRRGLPPLNINYQLPDGSLERNGRAMQSFDYLKAESDMQREWKKNHGITPDVLTVGEGKVVFMPEDDGNTQLTFGGGLYATEFYDKGKKRTDFRVNQRPIRDPKSNKVIGYRYDVSQGTQDDLGSMAHEPSFYDYSSIGCITADYAISEGQRITREDIEKPEYDDIRDELKHLMGWDRPRKYAIQPWMDEMVGEYKKKTREKGMISREIPATKPVAAKPEPATRTGKEAGFPEIAEPQIEEVAAVPPKEKTKVSTAIRGGAMKSSSSEGGEYKTATYRPAANHAKSAPAAEDYKPAHYVSPTPGEGVEKAATIPSSKPVEGIEGPPTIPYTSLGDSIIVGTDSFNRGKFVKLAYHARFNPPVRPGAVPQPEMVGQQTKYMVDRLRDEVLPSIEKTGIKTIVLGGGGNDIHNRLPTEDDYKKAYIEITKNLAEAYGLARGAGLHVVAITMPPFDRSIEQNFADAAEKERHYRLWEEVNKFIVRQEGQPNGPHKVVQSHELLRDPEDPRKLATRYTDPRDKIHPNREGKKLLAAEIEKAVNGVSSPAESPKEQKKNGHEGLEDSSVSFKESPEFNERIATYIYPEGDPNGMLVHINKPGNFDTNKPTRIIMYALPAGNTVPQTVGRVKEAGQDFHYGIQHVGAQTRYLREKITDQNIVIAYVQGPRGTLNSWVDTHKNNSPELLASLVEDVKNKVGAPNADVSLSSHSNGGKFETEYIKHFENIPDEVKRISFLDSINTVDIERNGQKIIEWLERNNDHKFNVISYDDREALYHGKPFPGQGSSYKKTMAMIDHFQRNGITLKPEGRSGYTLYSGMNGKIQIILLDNPTRTAILHSEPVLRNGVIVSETSNDKYQDIAEFNGEQVFASYIQKGHTDVTPGAPSGMLA